MKLFPLYSPPTGKAGSKIKEAINLQELSCHLGHLGYETVKLCSDRFGADLLASHFTSGRVLSIQLKSRVFFGKNYSGKKIWIAFKNKDCWYLYNHDNFLKIVDSHLHFTSTGDWRTKGVYSWPKFPQNQEQLLFPYRLVCCNCDCKYDLWDGDNDDGDLSGSDKIIE